MKSATTYEQRCSVCKSTFKTDNPLPAPQWPPNCGHCNFFRKHNPDFQCKCCRKPTCEECSNPVVGFCDTCKRKTYSHPDICEWCIERDVRDVKPGKEFVYCWVCHKFVKTLKRCSACKGNSVNLNCPVCKGVVPMCIPCFASNGGWKNARPKPPAGSKLTCDDVIASAVAYRLSKGIKQFPSFGARKFTRWNTKPWKKEERRKIKEELFWGPIRKKEFDAKWGKAKKIPIEK